MSRIRKAAGDSWRELQLKLHMTVQLHLAPPASGKTRQVIERVRAALRADPLARIWVVVPDRLHATGFYTRMAQSGGALGVRAGTFGELYQEILSLAGLTYPATPDSALHVILRDLVSGLAADGRLPYYESIFATPGFLRIVRDRIAELKRAMIWPEDLAHWLAHQEPPADGLDELALIYSTYQSRLRVLGWADPEGLNWLAVEALEGHPGLLEDWALIAVDGFVEFTTTQQRALSLLGSRVAALYITLPGEYSSRRGAHLRSRRSLDSLVRDLAPEIYTPRAVPRLPEPLAYLERHLFEPGAQHFPEQGYVGKGGPIHLVEARTPAEEAREALRWIKARHLRNRIPLERCAIFTQDPNLYGPALEEASEEFGLPLHVTWGRPLTAEPAVNALLELLTLPVRDYPRRLTLDAVRSPFFDLSGLGLRPEDAGALEEVSFTGQVIAGARAWREAFELARKATRSAAGKGWERIEAVDEELAPRSLPGESVLMRLEAALAAFMERLRAEGLRPVYDWVRWLEDLLEELDFPSRCENPNLLRSMRAALAGLALGETVTGAATQDYPAFLGAFSGALEGRGLHARERENRAVLAARLVEGWGLRFDAVAVLGLSEGIFPTPERTDPFISEAARAGLQLEPRLGRGQPGIFYQIVTRADQQLLLTRPYLAEGGEAWEPSPYWNAVTALFPEAVHRLNSEAPRRIEDAASPEEALFWAARQGVNPRQVAALAARAESVDHGRRVLACRLAEERRGPYEGFPAGIAAELSDYFGSRHTWSASRLEAYSGCPHRFYVENVLDLEARTAPEPGFDAAQLGAMLHHILERAYSRASDPTDAEEVLAQLELAAQAEFERAPEALGFRPTPLWESQQADLLARLEATVRALAEASAGWRPAAFERPFGLNGAPELRLQTRHGWVRLRGIIDRIDRDEAGRLRIIDYKTGGRGLDARDLLEGRRLQLPLYALAARDALGMGEPAEGFYWKIQAAEAGNLKLASFEDGEARGPQAAMELAVRYVEQILDGVRAAEFPPQPFRDGCPSYCAAAAWCWRYEKKNY